MKFKSNIAYIAYVALVALVAEVCIEYFHLSDYYLMIAIVLATASFKVKLRRRTDSDAPLEATVKFGLHHREKKDVPAKENNSKL